MAQEGSLELPERVVDKIQKVLGISPASLPEHDLVSLIEELCDTAEEAELLQVLARLNGTEPLRARLVGLMGDERVAVRIAAAIAVLSLAV